MAERRSGEALQGADGLRTLACLMVVFHHLSQQLTFNPAITAPPELRAIADGFASFGSAGVSVFFVLSGYLLAAPFWRSWFTAGTMPSLGHYAARRAARIVPGFSVNLLLFFVLAVLFTPEAPALLARYFAGLTFTSGFHWMTFFPAEENGPLWSIGFEVVSYALLPVGMAGLFAVPARRRTLAMGLAWWAVVWGAVLGLQALLQTVPPDEVGRGWQYGITGGGKEWMPRYNPVGLFAHFALGSVAAGVSVSWARRSWNRTRTGLFDGLSLLFFAAWVGLLVSRTNQDPFSWTILGEPYYFPFFPLLSAALLACLSQSGIVGRAFDNPFSRHTAKVSFGLYLWHTFVIGRLNGAIGDTFEWLLLVVLTLVLSYLVAQLSWKYIEEPFLLRPRRSARFYLGAAAVFVAAPLILVFAFRPTAAEWPRDADTAFAFVQRGPVTGLAFDGQGAAFAVQNGSEVYRIDADRTYHLIHRLGEVATVRLSFDRPRNEPFTVPTPALSILQAELPHYWNLKLGPDGNLYLAGGDRIDVLNRDGALVRSVRLPFEGPFGVVDLVFAPDGTLYTASGAHLYALPVGGEPHSLPPLVGLAPQVSGIAVAPDGSKLVLCTCDPLHLVDARIAELALTGSAGTKTTPAPGVFSVVWTARGPVFAQGFTGRLLVPEGNHLVSLATTHLGPNAAIATGPGWEPNTLYTANWNGTLGRTALPGALP